METTKQNLSETRIETIQAAAKYSLRNMKALRKDSRCGCYFCQSIFSPKEIEEWIDGEDTAICPYCWVDSVIGESSGYPITEDFLKEMGDYMFGF